MNIVYALQDPRTKEIRYVGKSTKGLKRPRYHLLPCYYASKKHDKFPLYIWIRKLIRLGLKPNIIIIQEVDTPENLSKAELYWIEYFKSVGSPLTNVLDASSMGNIGFRFSKEQKEKMSKTRKGRKSPESFSIAMKEYWKKNPKRNSNEAFKKAVSNGTKNWWKTLSKDKQATCKKNLNAGGRNKKPLRDNLGNIFSSCAEAAKIYGCTGGAITYCIKNNKKLHGKFSFEVI